MKAELTEVKREMVEKRLGEIKRSIGAYKAGLLCGLPLMIILIGIPIIILSFIGLQLAEKERLELLLQYGK